MGQFLMQLHIDYFRFLDQSGLVIFAFIYITIFYVKGILCLLFSEQNLEFSETKAVESKVKYTDPLVIWCKISYFHKSLEVFIL